MSLSRPDRNLWIAWDTETTGPDPLNDEIIELASVSSDKGFLERIKPNNPVSWKATQVHGISNIDLEKASNSAQVLKKWFHFISEEVTRHRRKTGLDFVNIVLVGHNSKTFDDPMLAAQLGRLNFKITDIRDLLPRTALFTADTLAAARAARKQGFLNIECLKLVRLYEPAVQI